MRLLDGLLRRPLISSDQSRCSFAEAPVTDCRWPFAEYSAGLRALEKADGLIRMGNFADAERVVREAFRSLGSDVAPLLRLAAVSHALADWPEAQRRWEAVMTCDPSIPYAYSNCAAAVAMQGNKRQAADRYEALMFRFRDDLGPPIALARLVADLTLTGLEHGVIAVYAEVADRGLLDRLARHPEHVGLLVAHAQVARWQGNLQAAHERFCLAHELARNNTDILRELREVIALREIRLDVEGKIGF